MEKILRIFENISKLIIIRLIQFPYNLLKFWIDFKKIFSKFEKRKCRKGRENFLGSFFLRFSSIESIASIVAGYRYYRIRQGIDTIELVSILSPSLNYTVDISKYSNSNFCSQISERGILTYSQMQHFICGYLWLSPVLLYQHVDSRLVAYTITSRTFAFVWRVADTHARK